MNVVPKEAIGRMFSALAPRYRLFNRWSSLGLDDRWRLRVVSEIGGARKILDLGTGTGDLARRIVKDQPQSFVVGIDLSHPMLIHGGFGPTLGSPKGVQGGADFLPFRGGSFDSVVSAFVLRNLFVGGVLPAAVRECHRVLAPGGRLVFLDLTRPKNVFVRWGHGIYGLTLLPAIGKAVFGTKWPGAYLARSIRDLPSPEALSRTFLNNGFSSFECRPLWGGIVSLFIGKK
jgi:demethylmenaquinone methyltransferase/2-methoxy-6-polyprenyl-1,4-benzoquinol methylase